MIAFFKAFGRFWYDFIVGDDWKIAASVVTALAITLGLSKAGLPDAAVTVIGGVLVLAAFTVSLTIDVRAAAKKR